MLVGVSNMGSVCVCLVSWFMHLHALPAWARSTPFHFGGRVTCVPRHDDVISVAPDNEPVNNAEAIGGCAIETRWLSVVATISYRSKIRTLLIILEVDILNLEPFGNILSPPLNSHRLSQINNLQGCTSDQLNLDSPFQRPDVPINHPH